MLTSRFAAPLLALLVPLALYGGALISQFGFGLHPCEMCYWQRWPHETAMVLAALALVLRRNPSVMRALTVMAALAIATSGAIGGFHAGVEYGWWEGLTRCSTATTAGFSIDDIMASPIVRCDVAQWQLGPISLAGFNAIFSTIGAAAVLWLMRRSPGPST